MNKRAKYLALILAFCLSLAGLTACDSSTTASDGAGVSAQTEASASGAEAAATSGEAENLPAQTLDVFDPAQVPSYTGSAFTIVHDNVPYFTQDDLTTNDFESYSPLDGYGRCGVAFACVGQSLMPTEERGSIGQVQPSGWHTVRYDIVDGKYLYNRCHLIGYQLSGENANAQNLITGTRYLNMEGMLPFENMVADYVKETAGHVLYRVTPVFNGADLVANGVLMEGYSVEDAGAGICFCVYAYNVQPGITIDYASGESWETTAAEHAASSAQPVAEETPQTYVLNNNSKKFHDPSCSSVTSMKAPEEVTTTRQALIDQGYSPCGNCKP